MARLTAILLAVSTLAGCGGTKPARDTTRPEVDAAAGRRQEARLLGLRKNRLIDHAVGALAGTCDQCFQQLEAIRPIITR